MAKSLTALILTLVLLASGLASFAEEANDAAYESLAVGTLTAFKGNFLSEIWGNSTSDADVRELLHAYDLVEWQHDLGSFVIDESVVSGVFVTQNGAGDRTYRFSLYEDLFYSNGSPIGAKDYAFALLLETAPEVQKLGANVSGRDYLVGAVERRLGREQAFEGVRLLGENEFSLTIRGDYLPSFYETGLLSVKPLPIDVIAPGCEVADDGAGAYIRNSAEYADDAPRFTQELLQETLLDPLGGYLSHPSVVSGPYVLLSYDGQKAEFTLNEYYKGNSAGEKPMIRDLSYELTTNDDMVAALENGELGLLNKVTASEPLNKGMALVSAGRHRMSNYARTGASFFSFSCERVAVGEASVRRAIARAIDRDTMIADYVGSFGMRVDGYYGIGQWMFEMVNGTIAPPLPEDEVEAEKVEAQWAQLSMDDVPKYEYDADAAVRELREGGWTLNGAGESFDPESDDVRWKAFDMDELTEGGHLHGVLEEGGVETEIDGRPCVLVPLRLTLIYPEGNAIEKDLEACVIAPLKAIGIELSARAVPMEELLNIYYRTQERDCDLIYLASNFARYFDPSMNFNPDDAYKGVYNRTGLVDQELFDRAVAMRATEPGDLYGYCEKWIAFQQRYQEVMPALSLYSNAYFDFYTDLLQEYTITQDVSWSNAILGAYLSDALPEEEEETEEAGEEEFEEFEGEELIEFD